MHDGFSTCTLCLTVSRIPFVLVVVLVLLVVDALVVVVVVVRSCLLCVR